MFLQNWRKLNKSGGGPWPERKTSHAACCLNYGQQFPQLLVTGGLDRKDRPLTDVWILDIHRGKWRKVKLKLTRSLFLGTSTYPMGSISQKCELVTSCLLLQFYYGKIYCSLFLVFENCHIDIVDVKKTFP